VGYQGATNTYFGQNAGANMTSGDTNTFIGASSGYWNTTGALNTFIGKSSGFNNTTGFENTFLGNSSGASNTQGAANTFLGFYSGFRNSMGNSNTFIGAGAGENNTIGIGNVFLGNSSGANEIGSNKLYIDNSVTTTPLIYGEFDNRILKINGTLIMASDERLKKNIEPLKSSLDKIMHLQGVSYEWRERKNERRGFAAQKEVGLIAQEVEAVLPELVHTDGIGLKAIAYDKIVPVLIEAVKEQQKELKEKDARIEKLEKTLDLIEKRLASIESPTLTVASNQ
jgi:hypothetical protein